MNIIIMHLKKDDIMTVDKTRYFTSGVYSAVALSESCLLLWKGIVSDFEFLISQDCCGEIIEESVIKESYTLDGEVKLVINMDVVNDFIFKH